MVARGFISRRKLFVPYDEQSDGFDTEYPRGVD